MGNALVSALLRIDPNAPNTDRLLDLLSHMLSGQPYVPLGAPVPLARKEAPVSQLAASQATGIDKTPEQLTLALTTLGSFDFSGEL